MITWKRSFIVALKILVVSILWYIVGMIIVFIGVAIAGADTIATQLEGPATSPEEAFGRFASLILAALAFVIVGALVAGLGSLATMVKFTVEEAVEEVRRELAPQYQPPPPPTSPTSTPPPPPPPRIGEETAEQRSEATFEF